MEKLDLVFEIVSEEMRGISEKAQKSLVRRMARKVGFVVQADVVEVGVSVSSENSRPLLVRVLEKRELLSQVLDFVGEGTEVAAMLVCKDVCKFVRLLRGWQKERSRILFMV
jgi:hypothetical protein